MQESPNLSVLGLPRTLDAHPTPQPYLSAEFLRFLLPLLAHGIGAGHGVPRAAPALRPQQPQPQGPSVAGPHQGDRRLLQHHRHPVDFQHVIPRLDPTGSGGRLRADAGHSRGAAARQLEAEASPGTRGDVDVLQAGDHPNAGGHVAAAPGQPEQRLAAQGGDGLPLDFHHLVARPQPRHRRTAAILHPEDVAWTGPAYLEPEGLGPALVGCRHGCNWKRSGGGGGGKEL